jgi:hypothetical protein
MIVRIHDGLFMDFLLRVDSPGLASLAHPLFTFGGKRVKLGVCYFFSLPSFPLAEERVTSEAKSGE